MATLASVLKDVLKEEIGRQVRQQTAAMAKSTARMEREITALKRQIQDLQGKSSPQRSPSAAKTAPAKEATKKATQKANGKAADAASKPAGQSGRARFSAKGLKAERERLGLSADNYAKLVGVTGLSIYNWEQGKARPRESSIAALASVKGISKREATKRLEDPAKPAPKAPKAPAPKTKAKAKAKPAAKEDQAANGGKEGGGKPESDS